jgi:hypothetical protein
MPRSGARHVVDQACIPVTAPTSASRHSKTGKPYHRVLFCRFCNRITSTLHNVRYQQSCGRGVALHAVWVRSMGYFVTELKTGKFQPEYAAKLNFCIAPVDDKHRREAHADTVGILICGSMNDHTVRYSLSRATSPRAVASYPTTPCPQTFATTCPTPTGSLPHWTGPRTPKTEDCGSPRAISAPGQPTGF